MVLHAFQCQWTLLSPCLTLCAHQYSDTFSFSYSITHAHSLGCSTYLCTATFRDSAYINTSPVIVSFDVLVFFKILTDLGRPDEWDMFVPVAQLMLNQKHRNLTNSSPFALFFNRSLNDFQSYTNVMSLDFTSTDLKSWLEREDYLHSQVFPVIRQRADFLPERQDRI